MTLMIGQCTCCGRRLGSHERASRWNGADVCGDCYNGLYSGAIQLHSDEGAEQSLIAPADSFAPSHQQAVVYAPSQTTVVYVQPHQPARWSPGVAALLSFFWAGLGQIYQGRVIAGLAWMVIVPAGYVAGFLALPPWGAALGAFLHLCCVIRASRRSPY